MCTYIAALLPPGADPVRIRLLADEHGLGWKEFSNRHLLAQVDPGSAWFLTSRNHCDCGTALGAAGPTGRAPSHDLESEVPALRRRGWSDAKIGRWRAQKTAAVERRQQVRANLAVERTPETDSWVEFLRWAVVSGATERVGVLIHDYTGRIEGERIAIKRRELVTVEGVTSERLCTMETDVLYAFKS
jgi:hypothetical protein